MKRLLSTQYGFFGFAALICWAVLIVIEAEHRWVAMGLGGLYAILSVLFLLHEISRGQRRPSVAADPADEPDALPPSGD